MICVLLSSSAGDAKVYERILDYNKIVEALALPKGLPDTNPYRSTPCETPSSYVCALSGLPKTLSSSNLPLFFAADVTTRFDQVFWFGDFNFRLSKERAEVENILSGITGGQMAPLLEHDQLTKEINDGALAVASP